MNCQVFFMISYHTIYVLRQNTVNCHVNADLNESKLLQVYNKSVISSKMVELFWFYSLKCNHEAFQAYFLSLLGCDDLTTNVKSRDMLNSTNLTCMHSIHVIYPKS